MNVSAMKKLSGVIPIMMSVTALLIVVGHAMRYGTAHEADEGAAAHLFQILMVAQAPVVAFFAIKWLPLNPKEALAVLGLQIGAGAAAFASVFFLT